MNQANYKTYKKLLETIKHQSKNNNILITK